MNRIKKNSVRNYLNTLIYKKLYNTVYAIFQCLHHAQIINHALLHNKMFEGRTKSKLKKVELKVTFYHNHYTLSLHGQGNTALEYLHNI